MAQAGNVTQLLQRWSEGDTDARDQAVERVYHDLKRIAAARLSGGANQVTLQPTALVNETWLKMLNAKQVEWSDRVHFIALSARIMRQILVDRARHNNAGKRQAGPCITLQTGMGVSDDDLVDLLHLDDALQRLEARHPERARLVELRYFGGLSIEETAHTMGLSTATINRNWRAARAWLYLQLQDDS